MENSVEKYGLDMHCTMLLEEYQESLPVFRKMREIVDKAIENGIKKGGFSLTAMDYESRVKEEKSLAGKLELKGHKYSTLSDITDLLGARIITFYAEDVDKVSAVVDRIFDVDWNESVDKRKMHDLASFGYSSLHYICRIPKSLYYDPQMPSLNEFRFEIQMRTGLQHVWATIHHDTGYKSDVEIPKEYLRRFNRLAGLLELADEQFSQLRTQITDYRREVQAFVADGQFDKVPLTVENFRSYLQLRPFDKLTKSIAALNQAEIHETTAMPYLTCLQELGFKNLGDVDKLIKQYSEAAYELAVYELGNTDLDIISSTVSIQDLLCVYILKTGGGCQELTAMFDSLSGASEYNKSRAQRLIDTCSHLKFMNEGN